MFGNGNSNGDGVRGYSADAGTDATAEAILASLSGAKKVGSRGTQAPRPATDPTLSQVAAALESAVATRPDVRASVEEAMARAAREALAKLDYQVPSQDEFLAMLRAPAVRSRGGTVARAFWWGFHIQISHQDLMVFLSSADPINAMIGAIGGGIPSPASPFIAIAAAFVAAALGLLRSLDRGNGVYVSMLWIAPGIFVPTTV